MAGMLPMIGFGVLMLLGVGLIMIGMRRSSQPDMISDRLSQFTERTMTLEEMELQQPFSQRVLVPLTKSILAKLGQYGPKQSAERLRTDPGARVEHPHVLYAHSDRCALR
jgi:tight adherence protein C